MSTAVSWWLRLPASHNVPPIHALSGQDDEAVGLREATERRGFTLFEVEGSNIRDTPSLFRIVAEAMSFPEYFRSNWNSLFDCLKDLLWWDSRGFVLLFRNADTFMASSPSDFERFVHVLVHTSRIRIVTDDVPLHLVFTGSDLVAAAIVKAVEEHLKEWPTPSG